MGPAQAIVPHRLRRAQTRAPAPRLLQEKPNRSNTAIHRRCEATAILPSASAAGALLTARYRWRAAASADRDAGAPRLNPYRAHRAESGRSGGHPTIARAALHRRRRPLRAAASVVNLRQSARRARRRYRARPIPDWPIQAGDPSCRPARRTHLAHADHHGHSAALLRIARRRPAPIPGPLSNPVIVRPDADGSTGSHTRPRRALKYGARADTPDNGRRLSYAH